MLYIIHILLSWLVFLCRLIFASFSFSLHFLQKPETGFIASDKSKFTSTIEIAVLPFVLI